MEDTISVFLKVQWVFLLLWSLMCPNGGVSHVCGAEAPSAVVELKNKKLQNDKMKRNDSVVFSRRGAN